MQVILRAEEPFRWADVMYNLYLSQSLRVYGDHIKSVEVLQRSVDTSRAALEVRTQETAPLLWAASQNNLGSALFMLGRNTNDSECLRQSVEAFREVLQLYEMHKGR